ncbi:MAG TPA: iron uptake system protein EfeO [Acidimicrobiales bacterium]|nr:iron uptake system protein EfeO [Acidimicrobiales bacterium]
MPRNRLITVAAVSLALVALGAACGNDDDGADVRDISEDCDGSGSASPSGSVSGSASPSGSSSASGSGSSDGSGSGCPSGSGSGSGSGIASEVGGSSTDNPLVQDAIDDYSAYVAEQVDETIAATTTFTDAVRAGDVEGAKAAYAPSRQGWERIEPIAGLVEEIDGKVDARVDDFAGEGDPAFTGWHRLEYILWELGTTDGAAEFADQLDADLQTLKTELEGIEIPPAALAVGSSELIEEVSGGKITGEEDRYSGTDLWDFAANVDGSQTAFELLVPALEEQDPELVTTIEEQFAELDDQLSAYAEGEGYQHYSALTEPDKTAMQTTLAELSESLATMAGVLGLE